MKTYSSIALVLSFVLAGCESQRVQNPIISGAYSMDAGHSCSNANQVTIYFERDGSAREVGYMPGLLDTNGVTVSWTRIGFWQSEGRLVKIAYDDGERTILKAEKYHGRTVLAEFPYNTVLSRDLQTRYVPCPEAPKTQKTEPNQAHKPKRGTGSFLLF